MSFEARVYIQGVGVYFPRENGELHVLFPDQEKAAERKIHEHKGIPVCRHHAVVQFDTSYLAAPDPTVPWTTLDISGLWVSLSAEPSSEGEAPELPRDPR